MTSVLIVAASAVVRAGLEAIVQSRSDLQVVGSISGLDTLAQHFEAAQPDVVLVELDRGEGGLAPAPLGLSAVAAASAVVALIDDPNGPGLEEALRLGARAVLPRDVAAEEILAAVEAAAAGLLVLHMDNAQALLPLLSSPARAASAETETLTPREIEVLGMLAEGAGNKQIARRLGISEHTVKFHVGSILGKLDASSRTEAVTVGVRHGLIML